MTFMSASVVRNTVISLIVLYDIPMIAITAVAVDRAKWIDGATCMAASQRHAALTYSVLELAVCVLSLAICIPVYWRYLSANGLSAREAIIRTINPKCGNFSAIAIAMFDMAMFIYGSVFTLKYWWWSPTFDCGVTKFAAISVVVQLALLLTFIAARLIFTALVVCMSPVRGRGFARSPDGSHMPEN